MTKTKNTGAITVTVTAATYAAMHEASAQAGKNMVGFCVRHADGTVTFPIDQDVARHLEDAKMRGETLSDVVERLLGTTNGRKAH